MKETLYTISLVLLFGLAHAQNECFEPDASIWLDTWKSCQESQGPNPNRSASHWIHYDFGGIQSLSKSWIWNTNEPGALETGIQEVVVDYSLDGENWQEWGEFTFEMGTGEAIYGGFAGPDFEGLEAQHVLITVLSNFGDPNCAGLSEIKFNLFYDQFLPETLDKEPNCDAPDYSQAAGIAGNISIILWHESENDQGYGIRIREVGSEEWLNYPVDEAVVYLDVLETGKSYEYQLRTWCNESWTQYSDTFQFTAIDHQLICGPPIASQIYFFSPLNAAIIWNLVPNVNRYRLQYREQGEETWTIVDVENLFYSIPNLKAGSIYEYQVQALCGDTWSEFSESRFFNAGTALEYGYFIEEDMTTDVINLQASIDIKVHPNPFHESIQLEYDSDESDILHVDVFDANGKKIWRDIFRTMPGMNQMNLDLPYLSDGIYMVQVSSIQSRGVFSEKLVKAGL